MYLYTITIESRVADRKYLLSSLIISCPLLHDFDAIILSTASFESKSSIKAIEKDSSEKDSKDTREMIEGWKVSEQLVNLETTYGTQFVFQHPESPEYMGLIERMHRTISQSMLSLKQANLRLTQFTTIVKGLQAIIDKRPLGGMNKENTDEIGFVTPGMLLTGYDMNVCPNYSLPKIDKRMIQNRAHIVRYTRHMKAL